MNRLVLPLFTVLAGGLSAQNLIMVSGSGQLVPASLTNVPLVVEAVNASGNAVPGVVIQWTATNDLILSNSTSPTDSNGLASTGCTGVVSQPNTTYQPSTVTASSSYGNVSFVVTSILQANTPGVYQPAFIAQLLQPPQGSTLTAASGSTVPGAFVIKITGADGAQSGIPLPNLNFQIFGGNESNLPSPAHCNGPDDAVLTDSTGTATCDLVVTGAPGTTAAMVGAAGDFMFTPGFELSVTAGASCTFSLSSNSQAISAAGGSESVNVTTASGCGWTASSYSGFITIDSGTTGAGSGTVSYTVAAESGAARSGALSIAGHAFIVNQAAGSAGSLAITTAATLPNGTVSQSYSTTLSASGGVPPDTWSITEGGLPAGITLNSSTGLLSGAPTTAATTSFTATVQDSAGTQASLGFSLTIAPSSSSFSIINTSFPNGILQQPYSQLLSAVGGEITAVLPYPSFRVSVGALPPGLAVVRNNDLSFSIAGTPTTPGAFAFTLTATDAGTNLTSANFTITVTGTPTSELMTVNPSTLAFTVQLGSASVPSIQNVSITGNSSQLNYTSAISTSSGGNWLVVENSTSGSTVGNLQVGVANYSTLQPGTYSGAITVSSQAANSPQVVLATLTVLGTPSLTIAPRQFTVSEGMSAVSNVSRQTIQVSAGTGALSFSAVGATAFGGNWLAVTPQSGTTPASLTVSVDDAGLSSGTYPGSITITPASGAAETVTITLNVISPATLSATPTPLLFAAHLPLATSTMIPPGSQPLAAQSITVSNKGTSTLSVSTAIAESGSPLPTSDNGTWLFASPGSGSTPFTLSVSVNASGLGFGSYNGTVTVTASDDSVKPLLIPVTLIVTAPLPIISAVTNGASFAQGAVAPGEIVTIFGSLLGSYTGVSAGSGPLPPRLDETAVFFDSFYGTVLYASASQVSVLVPYELAGATSTNVRVSYAVNGTESEPMQLTVTNAAPGIFTQNSSGQGAIINQDGSINSAANGAAPGSVVSIFATGEGQTSPAGVDGAINGSMLPLPAPLLPVSVEIGGLPAVVDYAGGAPLEVAGLLQVNVTIPAGVATGVSVPVVIKVGTATSQTGVTIAIKP